MSAGKYNSCVFGVRREPKFEFRCRKCACMVITSEDKLLANMLCTDCLDKRNIDMVDDAGRKVLQWGPGMYGRSSWLALCASCGVKYRMLPKDYIYDQIESDENVAPRGWCNELLCKQCFISLYSENRKEIDAENERDTLAKEKKFEDKIKQDYADKVSWRWAVMALGVAFILGFIRFCDGGNHSGMNEPDVYYNRR